MPLYTTKCQGCGRESSARLTFDQYDELKAGTGQLTCNGCGGDSKLEFNPGNVNFVLKDGESGGWISKAGKENKYRAARRGELARRERDHVFKPKLQPNVGGMLTHNWKDARDAAYETTYDKVKQEHGSQTASTAAVESAKTYDSLVSREVSGS